jgi:hypothetical protein
MKITFINIIKYTPPMFRYLICATILIADSRPLFIEKLKYYFSIILTLGPIIWLIEQISGWYIVNKQFADFIMVALILNLVIGVWYHMKMGSFCFVQFILKNSLMVLVLILGYSMLEMLRITFGNNVLAEGFKTVIQISTLLYPMSKALKNLYILSNKQFPPKFIMEKLYNFEKSGNIKDLFPEEENKNVENGPSNQE